MTVRLLTGDCRERMAELDANSVDACITDPPYGLKFMGKGWDHGVPGIEFWAEVLRVARPGTYLLAFGGTRTYHRLTCAIEDAGWEIRDTLCWLHGQGFPKSVNVSADARFCQCDALDSSHAPNDTVRRVWSGVSSIPENHAPGETPDMLASVQRDTARAGVEATRAQGAEGADAGELPTIGDAGLAQPSVEGRRDGVQEAWELLGSEVHPSAGMGAADGESGRLRNGAPASHGGDMRPTPNANGSRASSRPSASEQRARKSRTLARQPESQGGGAWPDCSRCGKPLISDGLGSALKPAFEPIILARKPVEGTIARNVEIYGVGALNIDACRIEGIVPKTTHGVTTGAHIGQLRGRPLCDSEPHPAGRWPANVCVDEEAAAMIDAQSGERPGASSNSAPATGVGFTRGASGLPLREGYSDTGGASRFYYCAKSSKAERWDYLSCDCEASNLVAWENEDRNRSDRTDYTSPRKATFAGISMGESNSPTSPHGNACMGASREDTKSTTSTRTSKTIDSTISDSSARQSTSESTADASCAVIDGGSLAASAASSSPSTPSIGISPAKAGRSTGVAVPATSRRSSATSNCAACGKPLKVTAHPTVKPVSLMRWLVRLITPPNGLVLDPFCGSGTTGIACHLEDRKFLGIEVSPEYAEIARARIAHASRQPSLFADVAV